MTTHSCPQCGYQTTCRYGSWWDRHPILAGFFGLPAFVFLIAAMATHWWLTIPVAMIGCTVYLARASRKRAALAARADADYRQMMLAAQRRQAATDELIHNTPLEDPPLVPPRNPAPWHVVTQLPTGKIRRFW